MLPLNGEASAPLLLDFRAAAKTSLANFAGAEDDCRVVFDTRPVNRSDHLYFACVYAIEAPDESANPEMKLRRVASALGQLKGNAGSRFEMGNSLKQFDNLGIVGMLSLRPGVKDLFHPPTPTAASTK